MLWSCRGCGTLYAPDQPKCPACGSTSYAEAPGAEQVATAVRDAPPPGTAAGTVQATTTTPPQAAAPLVQPKTA